MGNPFEGVAAPYDLSDRELLVHVFTRQDFLLNEMKKMNGRVSATERLSWCAVGGIAVIVFLSGIGGIIAGIVYG